MVGAKGVFDLYALFEFAQAPAANSLAAERVLQRSHDDSCLQP